MTNVALFALAAIALVVVPGPNLIYITARSLGEGRRAGIASALGVETGTLVHVAAAAAGLSALVAASATAFTAVRYAGAAYLVYLGIRTLRGGDETGPAPRPQRLRRVFLEGVLVNLFNPKVILFFLAFLPQFVDPDAGSVATQVLLLGVLLTAIGVTSDMVYAVAAGSLGDWLRARPRFRRRQRHATGLVYLGLGAVTAFAGGGQRRS